MTNRDEQARRTADALGLLTAGYTPEEVEQVLEGTLPWPGELTALSDPNNVLLEEVPDVGSRTR
jgi:hypothetical protein